MEEGIEFSGVAPRRLGCGRMKSEPPLLGDAPLILSKDEKNRLDALSRLASFMTSHRFQL